jgi:hypothetical protein
MRYLRVVGVMLVCVFGFSLCFGQQLAKKMGNQDVIAMVSLGLSDDVVIDKIHSAGATDFDTSIDALKTLKAGKGLGRGHSGHDQSATGPRSEQRASGCAARERFRNS